MKIIDGAKYYSMGEVSNIIRKTRCTILRWYEYEEDREVKLLPEYITLGKNNARYWKEDDLAKFNVFMQATHKGAMTSISKKYNGELNKSK